MTEPRHTTRTRRTARILFWSLSLGLIGCATSANAGGMDDGRPEAATTQVTVDNRNTEDIRVYVVRGDTRILIGPVGSLEQRTFALRPSLVGDSGFLQLEFVTLASRQAFATEFIPVARGKEVQWQIESNLALSTVMVR